MKAELDKKDLVSLIKGTSPAYSLFEDELIKSCGHYVGGFVDEWQWDEFALGRLSDNQLLELYRKIKEANE